MILHLQIFILKLIIKIYIVEIFVTELKKVILIK